MKGQIARRSMELGGFPVRTSTVSTPPPFEETVEGYYEPPESISEAMVAQTRLGGLPRVRLQAMRKIDPDLARMIESLAPVYLMKG